MEQKNHIIGIEMGFLSPTDSILSPLKSNQLETIFNTPYAKFVLIH